MMQIDPKRLQNEETTMSSEEQTAGASIAPRGSFWEVLLVFIRLGLSSFGGPVAHLGYFRDEIVNRRKWIDEAGYADLIALCQFLPGPASSQVGISLGVVRAGVFGGLAAWLGFTLPSALVMAAFAIGVTAFGAADLEWLRGLKIVAVAVVAHALWGMANRLCPDRERIAFAVAAALVMLFWSTAFSQVLVIVVAGLIGWRLLPGDTEHRSTPIRLGIPRGLAYASWGMLLLLLLGLPLLRQVNPNQALAVFDSFFRTGALVFGGGHVVLPLIRAEVVPPGWISDSQFLAGYGLAQAVPGPLFTFSAYLGAVSSLPPNGWAGAAIALVGIFLPSFLLLYGVLPFWNQLRSQPAVQSALRGVNAAVVGLLLAALYDPVWTSAIGGAPDFALALAAFTLLMFWKWPSWMVVIVAAAGGVALNLVGV
jgi:chromate transporter